MNAPVPNSERELVARAQRGDLRARNTLMTQNLGLVHHVARKYRRLVGAGAYDDLVQEGALGLVRAIELFDLRQDVKLSTYSVYWIKAKIGRFVLRAGAHRTPPVPGAKVEKNERGEFKRPTAAALSLETFWASDDEDGGLSVACSVENPEDFALRRERETTARKALADAVAALGDERFQAVVDRRLLTDDPDTNERIGADMGVSREAVRLWECKVLDEASRRLQRFRDD